MRMYDLIRKKRDGERLAKEEIDWMIRSYTNGEIPDYQDVCTDDGDLFSRDE